MKKQAFAYLTGAFLTLACLLAPAEAQPNPTALCQPGAVTGCQTMALPVGTSSAVESSHVLKNAIGTLSGFQANNTNGSSRWVLVFNAASAPSNGAQTGCAVAQTAGCLLKWYQIGANSTIGVSWSPGPPVFFNDGLVLTCSSTGPFTLTLTADCVFSGEVN